MEIYRVGDKVRVRSLEWYESNYSKNNSYFWVGSNTFAPSMSKLCGEIVTIKSLQVKEGKNTIEYLIEEDGGTYYWTNEMFSADEKVDYSYIKFEEFYIVYNTRTRKAYPDILDTIEDVNKLINELIIKQGP